MDPGVCKVCPFFHNTFKTGGKGQPQGLWMQTALACTFMRNGRKIFHLLSQKYKGYTREETDAMFDRKMAEREERNIGYPACQVFEDNGSQQCATCEHRGTIR